MSPLSRLIRRSWRDTKAREQREAAAARMAGRRLRPGVDLLEDRLAPAVVGTLSLAGTTLIYSGTSAPNAVTISGTDASLRISDAAGTIAVGSGLAGYFAGNGTGTVTGWLPSQVTNLVINGNSGVDTVTVGAAGVQLVDRGLTISSESIVLNGDVLTQSGPDGGAITLNGQVTADPVNAAGTTTIATNNGVLPTVVNRPIAINGRIVGTPALQFLTIDAGQTAGTAAIPGNVTLAGAVSLGGINSAMEVDGNNVAITSTIVAPGQTAALRGARPNLLVQAQNALTMTGGIVTGASGVSLNANMDGLGSQGYAATGDITVIDGQVQIAVGGLGGMLIRSINTVNVLDNLFDTVKLTAGGSIVPNPSSAAVALVRANSLTAVIAPPPTSAAATPGAVINLDASVSSLSSSSTQHAGGDVTIRNRGQALLVTSVATVEGSISISNDRPMTVGTGPGTVVAGGTSRTPRNLTLTTTGATSDLTLTDAEAPFGMLTVNSGASILQAAGPTIMAPSVVLRANGTVGTAGAGNELDVTTSTLFIAAAGANAGVVNVAVFGTALTLTGATTSGGAGADLTINAQGSLKVAGNVSSGGGNIALASNSQSPIFPAVSEGTFTFTSGVIYAPGGAVTLVASNSLSLARLTTVSAATAFTAFVFSPSNQTVFIGLAGTVKSLGDLTVTGSNGPVNLTATGPLAATGNVALTGDAANVNTFTVIGPVASGGTTTITGGTNRDTFIVVPTIAPSGSMTITASGLYTVVLSLASGTFAVNPGGTLIVFSGGPPYRPITLTNPALSVIRKL